MKHKKRDAVIIDIDGTLANNAHRRQFAIDKKWKEFMEGCGNDEPHEWCLELVMFCYHMGWVPLFVSGRSDEYASVTVLWMQEKCGFTSDLEINLFMRKRGDEREDTIVKEEIYEKELKHKYNIKFAVDDRSRIVQMWRSKGITCLQCADGDF